MSTKKEEIKEVVQEEEIQKVILDQLDEKAEDPNSETAGGLVISANDVKSAGGAKLAETNMIQKHLDNFLAKIAGETPVDEEVRDSTEYWLNKIAGGIPLDLITDADGHKRFQIFRPDPSTVTSGISSLACLNGHALTIVGIFAPGVYPIQTIACRYNLPKWLMDKIYTWSSDSKFVRSFFTRVRVFPSHLTDFVVNLDLLKNHLIANTLTVFLENETTVPNDQPVSFEITLVIE